MVPECKPEWNKEAITVFSRLPRLRRLQATPLLQTSLLLRLFNYFRGLGQNRDKCFVGLEELKPIKLTLIELMSNKIMNTTPSHIGKQC